MGWDEQPNLDAVRLIAAGRRDEPNADAFYRAWEAQAMWANGGFEMILTGGLAEERDEVLLALLQVGAAAEHSRTPG